MIENFATMVEKTKSNSNPTNLSIIHGLIETTQSQLTPKGPNCIFWQHSNLGQLTMNGIFIFFL